MSDISDKELEWLKADAELRGSCDYCKKQRVLLSHNQHGLWNCFDCFIKMNTMDNASNKGEQ